MHFSGQKAQREILKSLDTWSVKILPVQNYRGWHLGGYAGTTEYALPNQKRTHAFINNARSAYS